MEVGMEGSLRLLCSQEFIIFKKFPYNETLPLVLTCDASPFRIGAVLSHKMPDGTEYPIAFYSKTLSSAERKYGQLDKEALATVAGVKCFHEYLYGRDFDLITDHKPLFGIVAGGHPPPNTLSPRMTRWTIFLAAYNYRLIYRQGKDIGHTDALSWCPLPDLVEDPAPVAPVLLIEDFAASPVTAAEIAGQSVKDRVLSTVLNWVWRGWPEEPWAEEFE